MKSKKISYITLTSDLFLMLSFSYIIYGFFFGFERIGMESFKISTISYNAAVNICVLEIIFCATISYLLHRCNIPKVRIVVLILCILNIIYRIVNIMVVPSIFAGFMIFMGLILLINILFY